jgi:serine/threonine protein kinase
LPIKGWAADILTFAFHHPLKRIFWKDVTSVKFRSSHVDLQKNAKNSDSLIWNAFYKIDALYNSLLHKLDVHDDCLEISAASDSISIRLWELSRKERAQLFYTLRKCAPSIYLDAQVQEALVGSAVLKDPRYTEIWFDVLTRGKISENQKPLTVDQNLRDGKFTIKEQLTSGGQANIYLAADQAGEKVVLKEFQLTAGESLDALVESAAVFECESTLLSKLNHPGIVKLEDLFIDGNRVYLALEHIEGFTLRQLIQDHGPLCENSVLKLASQMCDILEYLHNQSPPLIHRDFTPDNLIRQPYGALKLIDFSVAQQQSSDRSDCAGKHSYTPPEQFRGEACPQSDIYALGATLYYLITGKEPEPISRLSVKEELVPISDQLNSIIEKCTELQLENRYQSIAWLKTDLAAMEPTSGSKAATSMAKLLEDASQNLRRQIQI